MMRRRESPNADSAGSDAAVRSVERALALMRAVAASGRAGCRFTDLCTQAKLSKSTTHRILLALLDGGMVEQDPETKLLYPGIELFLLGTAAAARFSIVEMARPSLLHLAEETGDTVFLSVPVAGDVLCADRQLGSFPIRTLTVDVGDRAPLGLGSGGLALLAFLDDAEIDARIAANESRLEKHVHFAPVGLRRLIATARRQGYAFVDGLLVEGMGAIGVPICDPTGRPIAALSVAAISSRLAARRRASVFQKILQEARRIERQLAALGGVRPATTPALDSQAKRSA
jgi:DNA-binding IclR family transcriptional regulator